MLRENKDKSKDIEKLLQELIKGREEWREMKLMILGHGRIGKSSLVNVMQHLSTQREMGECDMEPLVRVIF